MLVWPWWWRIGSLPTTTRVTAHCSGSRQKRTSKLFCSLHHRRVTIEMKIWISLLPLLASKSWCHEYYSGHCPEFPPMKNFLWEKVCWLWNCSPNAQSPSLPVGHGSWRGRQGRAPPASHTSSPGIKMDSGKISTHAMVIHFDNQHNYVWTNHLCRLLTTTRSVRQARQLLIGDTLGIDHEYMWANVSVWNDSQ